jgi:hypothetical protein
VQPRFFKEVGLDHPAPRRFREGGHCCCGVSKRRISHGNSLRRFRSRYEEHLNIIREALGRPIVDWVGSASPENKIGCSSAEQRVGPIGRPGVGGGWPHITTLPSSKPLRDYPELKEFVDVE